MIGSIANENLQPQNKLKPSLPLDRGGTEREYERTLSPGMTICDIHRGYLEVSLSLLLLCGQLQEWVLQCLRLGRVKLPLLLQCSGPLLILLHPAALYSKDNHSHPSTTHRKEGSHYLWWGTLYHLAALSKELLTGHCVSLQWHGHC